MSAWIADELSRVTGRTVHASEPPGPIMALLRLVAYAGGSMGNTFKVMAYIGTGRYVADVRRQTELFGPPPTLSDSIERWALANGLANASRD